MRTKEQEEQFLDILRAKVKAIAERDFFTVKGFVSPGQVIQAYKEATADWEEMQVKAKQPHIDHLNQLSKLC